MNLHVDFAVARDRLPAVNPVWRYATVGLLGLCGCDLVFGIDAGTPRVNVGGAGGDGAGDDGVGAAASGGHGGSHATCPAFSGSIPADCDGANLFSDTACCVAERDCGSGVCGNGKCSAFSVGESPSGEAIDVVVVRDTLVWSTGNTGQIVSAPLSGGTPTVLGEDPADGQKWATMLASDGSSVFFTQYSSDGIYKVGIDPASDVELVTKTSNGDEAGFGRIVVDDNTLFWATQSDGGLWVASATGDTPTATRFAVASAPRGVAVDDTYVYWTDDPGIYRYARSDINTSTQPTHLIEASNPTDLVLRDGSLFWIELEGGIRRASNDGTEIQTLDETSSTGPWALVVDDHFVWWTAEYDGQVNRTPVNGGPSQVWGGSDGPWGLAQTCDYIFWGTQTPASVFGLRK